MLKYSFARRAGYLGVTLLLFYFSTCCSLKCRTEDGPSESELKRITRNCMRKIGEGVRSSSGGPQGYSNNHNHYGPLHQSNFGAQYGGNSRYDYNYDYDDDNGQYNGNGNNNNYNNNNNNGNSNYDRDRGNRNVLQQRSRDRQQNGNSDNGRSTSSGSLSSGGNNNSGGRYDNNNNGKSNGGSGGSSSGGGSGNNGGGSGGGRNSGSASGQRGHTQNNSNNSNNNNNNNGNNNNNSNNKNANNNDTADVACVVHCFFEELNMLNSDDYPDRYKVQYGLTRDLRDRELRNFYTDTIQDCFHYLESQRRRDKCHYSRDLINCMTEYAKVNCDDWQEFNMVFN